MVESEHVVRVAVREVCVVLLALRHCGANRVAVVEVPDDEGLVADERGLAHEVVVVAVRRAHPSGLDAQDPHQGELNLPHLIVDCRALLEN